MSRSRGDAGVTLVEASFALPIMFMFIFGLIDIGMWTFNANKAANAARDGARAGILSYQFADVDPDGLSYMDHPEHRDTIVAAVRSRLPGQTIDADDVVINCERAGTTIPCSVATVDEDHIRVEVKWQWDLVTPVAGFIGLDRGVATGSATMAIVGSPAPATAEPEPEPEEPPPEEPVDPPVSCVVAALSTTPPSVESKGNQLEEKLLVEFTTNGSQACADLRIQLDGTKEDPTITTLEFPCGCGDELDDDDPTEYEWTYSGSNNIWKPGTGRVRVMNGADELLETTFTVT